MLHRAPTGGREGLRGQRLERGLGLEELLDIHRGRVAEAERDAGEPETGALGALHELVATVLKDRLGNDELCTAADINAAIKFLKDNNITATREANKALGELEDELGKHSLPQADDTELQAALDNIVNFPGSVANHA